MPSPLIYPTSSSTSTGITLATYWQRLADELGFYQQAPITSSAVNADASRVAIAAELRDDEAGYEFLGAPWVYVVEGPDTVKGTQRRMLSQPDVGYQGEHGAFVVSRPFPATLSSSSTIAVTSPLPVKRHLAIKGLHQIVNEALARIRIEARLTITGNGTYEYPLAAYQWLQSYDQTNGIYDTVWSGSPATPALLSPWPYGIVTNGITRTLTTSRSYSTAETFYLAVLVRADRLVNLGISWDYVETPGLFEDADRAAAPVEWVAAIGMVLALRQLDKLVRMKNGLDRQIRRDTIEDITRQRRQWARAANRIKFWEFPRPIQEPTQSMLAAPMSDRSWQ